MRPRHLDVTAYTTFDHVGARAEGDGWTDEAVAVLDVTSPAGEPTVSLGFELDPSDTPNLPHHADHVPLTPERARTLAAELEAAADAAEAGEAMTSGRG
ncbi:DUF6360 family protein [Candidatus Halobonum tyrrellensis]|uniref:Uncharacterized protein n=1 Tax=Candidatus Halobonum tyrrellensis G22 TaxID=1324957 RepID=V4IXD4_9EURY|nr:DUF6360 family protein [Candidatus Halobonum tyrrellensis]ESP87807.1 hypothetical protein K933_12066 [Candidatus Halobonum tyrrellensis G22]